MLTHYVLEYCIIKGASSHQHLKCHNYFCLSVCQAAANAKRGERGGQVSATKIAAVQVTEVAKWLMHKLELEEKEDGKRQKRRFMCAPRQW
jgi:hypothetical protein